MYFDDRKSVKHFREAMETLLGANVDSTDMQRAYDESRRRIEPSRACTTPSLLCDPTTTIQEQDSMTAYSGAEGPRRLSSRFPPRWTWGSFGNTLTF